MNPRVEDASSVMVVSEEKTKIKFLYFVVKRIFDLFIGLIGTIIVIPTAIVIKICYLLQKDFAPIFFTQERIGYGGKKIKIYKFRSMVPNGEEVLEKLMAENPEIREEYLKNKKLENDPRITKVGAVIRATSIDEFPQFINILKGDMSLVGPRPYLFREKEDMGKYYDEVIKCKPGLTGLWQVSGRSDVSFNYRLKLDKLYVMQRSIKFDIIIVVNTFGAVLGKKGAK